MEHPLQPVDLGDAELVRSVLRLLGGMIAADGDASAAIPRDMMLTPREYANYPGACCREASRDARGGASAGRALDINPGEVLCVIYLASLPLDARRDAVNENRDGRR